LCAQCGDRLGGTIIPPLIPLGTLIAGHEVVGARGGDLLARTREAGAETVLLALGSATLLGLEAEALRRLHIHSPVPRAIARGEDATYGPFLTVSLLDAMARPLSEAARSLRLEGVASLGRQVVDLVARIAGEGFSWEPFPEDFWLEDGGSLALSRVRCSARLERAAEADVRSAFEAVGGAFMPLPLSLGPTRLVRLFSSRMTGEASARLSPDAARAELTRAESERTSPPEETHRGITELSDRGLRRERNADASATAASASGSWAVLVVCDGVSSSASAGRAASIAAETTRDALAAFARSGDHPLAAARAAMSSAIETAHAALGTIPLSVADGRGDGRKADRIGKREPEPPGTTVVAALVLGRTLVVGWVGDSRAYWISPSGAELLTRDHSFAAESVLRGEMTEAQAMASPLAHALTRCLGPLEAGVDSRAEAGPDLCTRALSSPGYVVLCTDGLWNYFPTALDVASVVRVAGAGASTALIARCLVNHALARGGADNASVAVYRSA
jgi:PPM family protein phosphatase